MEGSNVKKLFVALAALAVLSGIGASAAKADPSVTVCHDVHVVVNGSDVLNEATCNTAP